MEPNELRRNHTDRYQSVSAALAESERQVDRLATAVETLRAEIGQMRLRCDRQTVCIEEQSNVLRECHGNYAAVHRALVRRHHCDVCGGSGMKISILAGEEAADLCDCWNEAESAIETLPPGEVNSEE